MSDAQTWRIQQLEKQVEDLQEEIRTLRTLRDNLIGIGWAAKWGLRILVLLGGWGAVDGLAKIIHWLQGPMR